MLIDCDTCAMRDIACTDCVVTMLLDGPNPLAAPLEFDDDEWQAVDALAEAGLIAPLRLVPLMSAARTASAATVGKPTPRSTAVGPERGAPRPRRSIA